jgi:hypothetical protein
VRRRVDPVHLDLSPVKEGRLYYGARDFLDDDDADGDPLDRGELTPSGAGAEADLHCPSPAEATPSP